MKMSKVKIELKNVRVVVFGLNIFGFVFTTMNNLKKSEVHIGSINLTEVKENDRNGKNN